MSITKRYFTLPVERALVGLIDPLGADHLDVSDKAVLGAEVQHSCGACGQPVRRGAVVGIDHVVVVVR